MDNLPKNKVLQTILQSWSAHCAGHFSCEVALSGGLDSVVLLHALCALRDRLQITVSAVHVHHGLQAIADEWTLFCKELCAQWHVPLRVERVSVDASGLGVEAAARQARYAVFAESPQAIVALAHHSDDQTETFFLSVLRGGGVRGMSAMPTLRSLNEKVHLWRPLLPLTRAELTQYATAHKLPFITDPSNTDTQYLRNWLRHQLLPQLQQRIPAATTHVLRNIDNLQQILALLDEVIAADFAAVCCSDGVLDCRAWSELSSARRHEVLRRFAQVHQLGIPSVHAVRDFAQHLSAKPQGHHVWHLPHGTAQAQYGYLWAWAEQGRVRSGQWQLDDIIWSEAEWGLPPCNWQKSHTIRTVSAQDVLATRGGRKNVVKLLQERNIPAFVRRYWPVLVDADNICRAVIGVRCDEILSVPGGKRPDIADFARFQTELYRNSPV